MSRCTTFGLALLLGVCACFTAEADPRNRASVPTRVSWQHKGIALGLFAEERGFDYGSLIAEIAATGASHVSVVVPYYQHSIHSVRIGPHPRLSPADDVVARTVRQARRAGLQVLLFPILRLAYQVTADEWRGSIAPKDPTIWWQEYGRFILKYARMAARTGAEALCVGSELESMDGDPAPWRTLIARVRRAYRGQLVYSANWFHFEQTAIWQLVDVAGISAYFWLVAEHEQQPSLERLIHGWREYRARIARWWARVRKPLIFTEVGYRSAKGTAARPWNESTTQPVDLEAQVEVLRAFARVWRSARFLQGIYLWNWFGWGGPTSREFTPRGKPAAEVICSWFGASADQCPRTHGHLPKP